MSIIVPPQDLAPSVASRIVTLKFAELHEGSIEGSASVTFTLPGDLRVPADDVIIRAGAVTVELDQDGAGQVRLPTHDPDAIGDGVGSGWYLLVKKSWNEQVDMIRIPAGTGAISLADISPVVEITPAMSQWLITNAAVSVVEGGAWGATVSVAGGIASFNFTVPPGGTTWKLPALSANADLSALVDGVHPVGAGSIAASFIGPPQLPAVARFEGVLEMRTQTTPGPRRIASYTVLRMPGYGFQRWETIFNGTTWSAWKLTSGPVHTEALGYTSLDALPDGFHPVSSGQTIINLGLPGSTAGYLLAIEIGGIAARKSVEFTTITGDVFQAVRDGGVWSAFEQINGGTVVAGGDASGWKATALAVTAARSFLAAPLSGTWRTPVLWNVPTRRFRLRINLRSARQDGFVYGAGVTLDGVWLGDHASNGSFTGTPVQIAASTVIPDSGADWVSDWIDLPIGENVERLLSFSYTAATAPSYMVGYGWEHTGKVGGEVAPVGGIAKVTVPMDIHVEAEIPETVPVVAVVGDSKSCGVGAARSIFDSTLNQWCRMHGAAPMHFSSSGDTMNLYAAGTWKVNRWDGVVDRPDYALIELGVNDLSASTAATVQASRATLVGKVQANISYEIGVVTIAPNEGESAGAKTERLAYNAALRAALPSGINRLFDFDQAIKLDDSTIRPEYDADGLHLNAAGYAAEGATLRHIVAPVRAG